ncbi:filamentous hemagglutinin N-terminal domain-containing protein [Niveispirillum sp.]|uniref:filamentous hemagglutinin N-terminal domain-containing protein n=1 Tax=Niveispirillum sp. TaxID=1917217 RepID=UPI001B486796|nr:filamentous hemagglutinin N-terminal domain-containing protein [Niveispirillum sp.]MBP7335489.1 filamentous hemagglutinin N-terminal domain-containing protein [Niveispirillum sp.]
MKNHRFSRPLSLTGLPGFQRQRHHLRENLLTTAASLMAATRKAPAGNRRQRRAGLVATMGGFAYALSSLFTQAAWANPTGGTVVAGQASIVAATPQTLNIVQGSDKAIINWQGFSIAAGETVNFLQPTSQSVTLNRVIGSDPSAIFGSITANGTVMLVNPNGVFFGKESRVDVGGLVATTANIADTDFLAGNYAFNQASANLNAGIVNEGLISIKDSGLAALVAPSVRNSGIIQARLGKVALGGAQRFTLDFQGDGLLSFNAGSTVTDLAPGADGVAKALVVNSGQIAAEGGTVVLSARAVKGVIDNVINTDGVISATSISGSSGKIVLSGGTGKVQVAGTVDASGAKAGQTGGTVVVDAADIQVAAGARIDASGDQGGGTIAIGSNGDRTGAWAAGRVGIAEGATLAADALTHGDGGSVTVLSQQRTDFAGAISAKGGATGGDGGFAEVSSRDAITLTGHVDLSAVQGATGTFLLDPASLKIVSGSSGTLDGGISSGSLPASTADSGANTVSATTLQAINATTNIVLEATGLITVDTSLNLQTGSGNSFTLRSTGAGGGITFTSATHEIATAGGAITLDASLTGASLSNIGKLTSNGGNITLLSGDNVSLAGAINAGAGAIKIEAISGNISNVSGAPKLTGASISLATPGGHIGASGAAIAISASALTVKGGGDIFVANDQALSSLSLTTGHLLTSTTNSYGITATGLTFAVTDGASNLTLTDISSTGNMALSVISDRGLAVGVINAGTGNISLTANGGTITRTGSSPRITGGALTMVAKGTSGSNGTIGTSDAPLLTTVSSLSAETGTLVMVDNTGALALNRLLLASGSAGITASGTLTVGEVIFASGGTVTLTSSGGAILDDGVAGTRIKAGDLTLTAASNIGTSAAPILASNATSVTATASNGGAYISTETSTTFTVAANGGDIVLKTTGSAILDDVSIASGTGNIEVTADGNLYYNIVNAGTGNVTLTGSVVAKSILDSNQQITADLVTAKATGVSGSVELLTTASKISGSAVTNLTIVQNGAVILGDLSAAGTISVTVDGGGTTTLEGKVVSTAGSATFDLSGALATRVGSLLSAAGITMTVDGAIGDSTNALKTATQAMNITNTGDIYIDNTGSLLGTLVINNKHNGSTPNALSLASGGQVFTVADNGTTVTISELSSTFITSFSFTSDKNLVLGRLDIENATKATIITTSGSILDDGRSDSFINAKSISLSATEGIGASGQALGVKTTELVVVTAGDLVIANESHFNSLTISSKHRDSTADYTYAIKGQHLDFRLTDSSNGYLFERLIDTGYATDVGGLNLFTFTGDRDITLGNINTGAFDYSYTPEGSQSTTTTGNGVGFKTTSGAILDDGDDSTGVLASYIALQATRNIGAVTASADIDITAKGLSVTAGTASDLTAGTGGVYITAQRSVGVGNLGVLTLGNSERLGSGFSTVSGDIVVTLLAGDIKNSTTIGTVDGSLTLETVAGSILGNSKVSASDNVTLKASGNIGLLADNNVVQVTASELDVIATTGEVAVQAAARSSSNLVKFNEVTAGGDIAVGVTNANAALGAIIANNGTGKITITNTSSSSAINDDGDNGTLIRGSQIAITAAGGVGNSSQLKLDTAKLDINAPGTIDIAASQVLTDLKVTRSGNGGTVSITGTGQTVGISDTSSASTLSTLTSATDLNFTLAATGDRSATVGAANVGTNGTFTVTADRNITYGGSGAVTAGTVSLTAGTLYSIGTSANKIQLSTNKVNVTAGRNIYVNSATSLTHVDITSTNSTTAANTASIFGITGASGPEYSLSDNGTTVVVDVIGSATSFSLAVKKNISVSEIVATGAVSLKTVDGGANSNITMIGGGAILGSSVTLSATGTGSGNGSIGSSSRAVKTSASSLNITSNGDIFLNNSNTALTTLAVTSTHKTSALADTNTYSISAIGSNRSFTVTEDAGVQTVGLTTPNNGSMDFSYSVDRAIRVSKIDAGTSATGKVSLTSTGGASTGNTRVYGFITGDNQDGTITAGEVTVSAKSSNGDIGNNDAMFFIDTTKLYIASGGSIRWDNSTRLTDLTLDIDFKISGSVNSGSYTYEVLGSNMPSLSMVATVTSGSVSALSISSISQSSGLNLTVLSTKKINVSSINVGTGTVKLAANSGSSKQNVDAARTSSVVTAGRLEIEAASIGNTSSGSPFAATVGQLKIDASGSIDFRNTGNLAVDTVSNRVSGSRTSATLTVSNGSLTQLAGGEGIRSGELTLAVEGGDIGTSATALKIDAETLDLNSGGNVYLNNRSDLTELTWTLKHNATNVYGITGRNLDVQMSTDGGGNTLITRFVDDTGLDLDLKLNNNLVVGVINVQKGRELSLTTTGTTQNISRIGTGNNMLTAGKLSLKATGGILRNGSSEALQTDVSALVVDTLNDVFIDNQADLQTLSIKNGRTSSDGAATYALTARNATIAITGSSSYAVALTDTTGLDFTFDTKLSQVIGIVDVTKAGTATFNSTASIFGGANSSLSHINAGTLSMSGILLGSSGNRLYIDAPTVALRTQGDVYVTSETHIDSLALTNSSNDSTANRTFDIVSAAVDGTAGAVQIQATHTNADGTQFSQIRDVSGMDFTYSGDRTIIVDEIEIGGAGKLVLTARSGSIRELDGTSFIKAGRIEMYASSGLIGQASGTGGGLLDITTAQLKLAANNGAYLDFKQSAKIAGFTVGGASEIKFSAGDLRISGSEDPDGSMSLNGAATTINVTNGSILGGGTIAGAGTLTLTASGSIGSVGKVLQINANSSGTTTLTATASGGGVYISESYGLTVSSLSAAGDVVLNAGSSSYARDFTLAGALTAAGNKVAITVIGGSIKSTTSSAIEAGEVVLSATSGSIGESTNATTRVKTNTTKLTLKSSGSIVVGSNADLSDLTIDRNAALASTAANGALSVTATNLTFTAADTSGTVLTNVTDTTGLNFTYLSKGNSISVGTISVGSGNVALTIDPTTGQSTTSSITMANGGTGITAGTLKLTNNNTRSGSSIGASGTPLLTNVDTLTFSTAGDAYISNGKALTTGALSASGALSVVTTSGDLTLNGAVSWGNSALTLEAAGALNSNRIGLSATGTSAAINLKAGTGIGSASTPLSLTPYVSGSNSSSVAATITGNGSAYLGITGGLPGGLSVGVKNGSINVTGGGALTLANLSITDDAAGNDINVTASGNISIGSTGAAGTVSAGMGNGMVVLTSSNGAIIQGHANSGISGGGVLLNTSSAIGTSVAALGVNSRNFQAASGLNATGVYLKTSGTELAITSLSSNNGVINIAGGSGVSIDLGKVTSGGGAITVTASGNSLIRVGTVNAGSGDVTLNAGTGTIVDDGVADTGITGTTLSLTAGTGIGTASAGINTNVATITGGTSGAGSVYISDSNSSGISLGTSGTALAVANGALSVSAAGPVAVVNVTQGTDGVDKDVTITTSSGAVTITKLYAGTTTSSGSPSSSKASISAATDILTSGTDTHIIAGKLSLTAGNGDIGVVTDLATGAGSPVLVKVSSIAGLSAAKAGAVVSISNSGTGSSTLSSGALTLGTGASAFIKTAGDLSIDSLSLTSGNLLLDSGGTLTLPSSGSFSTTGNITLKGATDIVAGASGRSLSITAAELVLVSGSAGGNTSLTTTAGKMNISLTGNDKNLTVSNTGTVSALTLAAKGDISFTNNLAFAADSVSATGTNRTVTLTATTGDLTLGSISADTTGTLTLNAASGKILSAVGGSTLTGLTLNMTTSSGIGTADSAFVTTFTKVSATVTGTGGIYLSGTNFELGDLKTNNGDIEVTTTGYITDANMVDGFVAGGSGNVKLTATGNVTLAKTYTTTGSDTTRSGFSVEGAAISLSGTISTTGAQSYKGNVTTNGGFTAKALTVTGDVNLGNATILTRGINTVSGNGNVSITGKLEGGTDLKDVTISAGTGAVTIGGVASGLGSLTVTAATINVAGVSTAASQTYTGAVTTTGTYTVGSDNNLTITGATTLAGDTIFSLGTGTATLTGTVNGAHALTFNSDGAVVVTGAVGGTTALASLTTDSDGTSSFKSVTTTGAQSYGDTVTLNGTYTTSNAAVTVSGDATLASAITINAGTGNVAFGSTVNGAYALTVNSTGDTSFTGVVGGTTALTSLTTNAGGTLALAAVTTTGAQSYGESSTTLNGNLTSTGNGAIGIGGDVSLGGDVTLSAGSGAISVTGTINGARALVLNSTGATTLSGVVGGTTALTSLTTDSGGTASLKSVTTTGAQTYAGSSVTLDGTYTAGAAFSLTAPVILAGDTVIDAGTNGITITGTVNGAHALTLNSSGATAVSGVIGGTTALASVTTNAGGTLTLSANVTTNGAQSYGEDVTLNGGTLTTNGGAFTIGGTTTLGTNVTVNAGAGAITLSGAVNGARSLTLNSSGATAITGAVGGTTALTSLTTDAGGTTALANVTTSGAQTYNDAVTLNGATYATSNSLFTIAGATNLAADATITTGTGAITLSGTVDGAQALVLNSSGVTTLSGAVGGTTALTSLTTNAGGSSVLANVATNGAQTYNDAVSLAGTYMTGSGAFTANGAVTLTADTSVSAGTGDIDFASTINGAFALTVNSGGTTRFDGIVGGTTALASLTSDAVGNTELNKAITTTGNQTYNDEISLAGGSLTASTGNITIVGALTLVTDSTIDSGTGNITLSSTVDGARALTLNSSGTTDVAGVVGGVTALTSLTTDANGAVNLLSVTTTGAQTIGGSGGSLVGTYQAGGAFTLSAPVTLTGATTIDAASITISGAVNGAQTLALNSSGATIVSADLGGTTALTSLVTDTGGTSSFRSVATSGVQTFNDAVTLNGTYATVNSQFTAEKTVTLAGDAIIRTGTGAVDFKDTVNGAHALTVNSSGATRFAADVGGTTALAGVTTDAGGTVALANVTTNGAQSYGETATIGGTYSSGNGTVTFSGPVTLLANTIVSSGSGAIRFGSSIDGGYSLTLNSSGAASVSGVIGGGDALTSLTSNAGGSISVVTVTTTGSQIYGDAATIDGALTTNNSAISFASSVTLAGNSSVNTGTADITVDGSINGAYALELNSSGATKLLGDVGNVQALAQLITDAGGTSSVRSISTDGTQTFNDAVTLSGVYNTRNGAFTAATSATLGGDSTINAGSGAINFQGAVNGGFALEANSQGATSFAATVGGSSALASLVTDAGGTSTLQDVTTTGRITIQDNATIGGNYTSTGNGAATFNGAVTLVSDTTVSTGSGAIGFGGTVDGGSALVLNSGGTTTLSRSVGSRNALTSLTTDGPGSTSLVDVTTSGAQTYNDAVTLNGTYRTSNAEFNAKGAATLAGDALVATGGGGITFGGTVDGGHGLRLESSGATRLTGTVGGAGALSSLTTDAGGTTTALSVSTSGDQTYGDDATLNGTYSTAGGSFLTKGTLTLAGDTRITSGSGNITFDAAVNGARTLALSSGGTITAKTAIGAGTALASLSTDGGGTINFLSITTSGAQNLAGGAGSLNGTYSAGSFTLTAPVTLTGATTITAGSIDIGAGINGDQALALNSSGTVTVTAALGTGTALASLTTDSGGSSSFAGVDTSGMQTYNDATTLSGSFTAGGGFVANGATTLAAATIVNSNGGAVTFNGSLDGTQALTINAGAGNVAFNGAVGARQALGALTINSSGLTRLSAIGVNAFSIHTDSAGTLDLGGPTMTTVGEQSYGEVLVLSGNTTLAGSTITLGQGAQGGHALTIKGDLVMQSSVGNGSALASLTVSGNTVLGGSVTTTGDQKYQGGATIGASTVLTAGGRVDFGSALDGPGSLRVNSSGVTRFGGAVRIGALETDAGGTVEIADSVTTTGNQSYGELLRLDGTSITLAGSTVTLGAGADGKGSLTINGNAVINGNVGATNALTDLSISGTTNLLGGTVKTSGSQNFGGLLTLTGDTGLTGGTVTLRNGATGNRALTITGDAVLEGGAGATLASLTVTGGTVLNGGTVTTTGGQSYGRAVTLNGNQVLTTTGGRISFAGTIDGGSNLTINAGASDVVFTGAVGGNSRLGTLTVNSSGLTSFAAAGMNMAAIVTDAAGTLNLNGGAITTSGAQTYGEAVNLAVDTILTGSTITLDQGASGNRALTIDGNAVLGGAIDLSTLSVSGTTLLDGKTVTTSGTQTYGGAVTLAGDTRLTAALVSVGGAIDGAFTLTVVGDAAFAGAIGAGTALTGLDVGGAATLTGGTITTSGAQRFGGAVTLGADSLLDGGSVDFQGAVSGPFALRVNSAGLTRFGGIVSVGALATDAAGSLSLANGRVTTTGAQTYGERLDLTADTTLSGTSVTLNQGADGAFDLSIIGDAVFGGALGADTALTSIDVSGNTLLNDARPVAPEGAQALVQSAALNGSTLISAGSVNFQGTVTGTGDLTVNSAGITRFGGAVSLGSLTTDAAGSLSLAGGSVTTQAAQTYGERLTLTADTLLTGTIVTLNQGADGARALTIKGDAVIDGAVGTAVALTSLNVSGSSRLRGGSIVTSGTQSFGGAVTLAGNMLLTGSTISLAQGADGAFSLGISGDAVIGGAVGTQTALTTLSIDGTTALNGGSIATSGAQTYGGAVTLAGDVLLSGGSVDLQGAVTGPAGLTVNSAGVTRFGGTVTVGSLTTDAAGSLLLAGSGITTTGAQRFGERLTLAADTTLTGSTITLTQGADGAHALTIRGNAVIQGAVGAGTALSSLAITGTSALAATITSSGAQTYGGAVTLAGDTALSGGAVTFDGTVDGAHALSVTGPVSFAGAIGAGTALTGLDVNGAAGLNGGGATTSGTQRFNGAVTLGGATRITTGSGDALFAGPVNGAFTLTVDSAGLTRFGGTVTVSTLTTDAAGALTLAGGSITTSGAQTFGERALLASDMVLTGSIVTLGQGAAGSQSLTITGDGIIKGDLGTGNALRSLSVGGRTTLGGTINTTGAQSYGGPVTLAAASTLNSNAGSLTFGGAVDSNGGASLTLVTANGGNVAFNGAVSVGSLNATGGNISFTGATTATTGAISLTSNSSTGVISFAANAAVQAATGFTQAGGARVLLPSSVVVTIGDITFAAPAELPAGAASISTNGTITLPGLTGTSTNLTLAAGTGGLLIGVSGGAPAQTLQVLSLTVPTAGRASMFGTIGNSRGAQAATVIRSTLRAAPYFMNDTPWGQVEEVTQVVSVLVPKTPVPSTPTATALFSGTVTSAGLTPNALSAYQAPQVLTTVTILGAGNTPQVLETTGGGAPVLGSGGSVGSGATGTSSPSVITTTPAPGEATSGSGTSSPSTSTTDQEKEPRN